MQTAALRKNETQALEALFDLAVLDSHPEPEFDALTQSAARVCGVPIARISLLDRHRQWFKSSVGSDARQTERALSFCAYAVLEDDLFMVEDTREDDRFKDHPWVTGGPGLRFYAAVPLQLPGDVCIGTLCVMDRVPRRLTRTQQSALRQLGLAVVRSLQGRAALQSLHSSPLTPTSAGIALRQVKSALTHVDEAMSQLFAGQEDPGRHSASTASESHGLTERTAGTARYRDRDKRRLQALHCCLTAAAVLLAAAHRLLLREDAFTARQRRLSWQQSADDAKVANHSATRAARLLSEPFADMELVHGR